MPIAGTPRLTTTYSYDQGGLLSKMEYNDGTPTTLSNYLPGRQFTYAYDNLGNRTTAKSGGVTSGSEASLRTITYAAANALNQYSLITNPSTFDVTGISLTPANYNPNDSATEPVAVKVGTGAQLKATTRNPSTASTYARWHRESTSTVTTGSQARVDSVTVYENGTIKNTGKMKTTNELVGSNS